MSKTDEDIAIKVSHVYKSFNIYYDRANTLKEIKEEKKEKY